MTANHIHIGLRAKSIGMIYNKECQFSSKQFVAPSKSKLSYRIANPNAYSNHDNSDGRHHYSIDYDARNIDKDAYGKPDIEEYLSRNSRYLKLPKIVSICLHRCQNAAFE
jgi:hypothetical protein